MDQTLKEQIGNSATEVFSTMYFLPVQLLDEKPSKEKWDLENLYISASISFTGPLSAKINIFFPKSLAINIAEGFLGIDPGDITEQLALDTMQEAANMVIGSFLGKADPDGVCKLGIPKAEQISDFSPGAIEPGAELLAFTSEFGYMWLTYKE